jgi:hypothetical protein
MQVNDNIKAINENSFLADISEKLVLAGRAGVTQISKKKLLNKTI